MAAGVLELTDETFDSTISDSDKPVFVDFWGFHCDPCKRVAPIVEELAQELDGQAVIAKMNVHEHQEIPARFQISSVPTLMVFKGGELRERLLGAKPKPFLLEAIRRFM